ncbi:MAG: hypothetical protein EHM59_15805 [Betaproteobacteria bacterium]|nr:MAG: hypothetical protein EHM59_15805 [Betaproteobacteria bacterium]
MRLHQIRIDYHPEHDRLLLRVNTDDAAELRFWLTRRFVKGLWPALIKMAETVGEARAQPDPTVRKAMLEFEHEKAVRQADFATPYKAPSNLPLGAEPLLVTRLRAQPDGRGNAVIALHPRQGQGMDLAMDAMLLHSFTRLLQGAVGKTDWDVRLELPKAPLPTASVADGPKYN